MPGLTGLRATPLLLASALAALPCAADAWGFTGHRIVAEMAYARLSENAKQGVRFILGLETLSRISTWPDEIRSDEDERYRRTFAWHYIDIPDGETSATAARSPNGDALSALQAMEKVLRSRFADPAQKRDALSFVVHILADIHQPLHVGNPRDRGCNACMVLWFGERTNLHAVWDAGLVDRLQLSYSEYARSLLQGMTEDQARAWATGNYEDWIAESQAYRRKVYPAPVRSAQSGAAVPYCASDSEQIIDDQARPSLGFEYLHRQRPLLDQRLRQAGVRLALTLERIFRR